MASTFRSNDPVTRIALATTTSDDMREDFAYSEPQRYVYRDIAFGVDLFGGLQFGFRNADLAQPLDGRSVEEIVRDLPQPAPLMPAVALSSAYQSPLDLQAWGDPIYIILRLVSPSNMTFHPERKAVSHKTLGPRDRYGLLRHVTAAGHTAEPGASCKVIHFACVPGNVDPYHDGLNLRVRLQQQPHLGPPQVERVLDLDIDPDIRFPGGSAT
ncbi:MAG: hypothetical protein JOZ90_14645 [Alphaproteobacteria bacterium]|nr:hypothetical protein [Alphaproteobacteria bacterium]MBV9372181.1 hypothetical protein [Alphaproteobacteria bacterium]MBV9902312.1 hypothetical protein [Alphaproteobacteria bacterium]